MSQAKRATTARMRPYTHHCRPTIADLHTCILDAEEYILGCIPATDDFNAYINRRWFLRGGRWQLHSVCLFNIRCCWFLFYLCLLKSKCDEN